ncbi:hypothetical protein SynNOUM97013_00423 [Synechococcus sp. NOUM97013]|nr:hypothetical protein SynNOUM97013_00423 [Synechococcus sp. NOUM97013]
MFIHAALQPPPKQQDRHQAARFWSGSPIQIGQGHGPSSRQDIARNVGPCWISC